MSKMINMNTITKDGYKIPITAANYKIIKKDLILNEKMTKFNEHRKDRKKIYCYQKSKRSFYLPRWYGIHTFGLPEKGHEEHYTPEEISIENSHFQGKLRDFQEEIVDKTKEFLFNEKDRGGILNLSTGSGKTVIALYIISVLRLRTIIFVNKQILLDQWIERIHQFLPHASIGIIQGKKFETDRDITIAMLQTTSQNAKDFKGKFETFGLSIVDECHNICTETFSNVLNIVQPKYRLGLSATLRKDGFQKVYEYQIGPVIITYKPTIVVPDVHMYTLDHDIPVEFNKYTQNPNFSKLITDITEDKERNKDIIRILSEEIFPSTTDVNHWRKVIVFTERVQHAKKLCDDFMAYQESLDTTIRVRCDTFIGKKKKRELEEAKEANVIFATYSIAKEGFDLPSLDTLLFATPKKEIEQAVGRILRKKNKNKPLVIDINDNMIKILKGQLYKRRAFYKRKGYKITLKEIESYNTPT